MPMESRRRLIKVGGLCGIVTPVLISAFILSAIYLSPWFDWMENALSDLGVNGVAAVLFNTGLILSGLLTLIFAFGLRETLRDRKSNQIGVAILMLAAVALSCIGFFPETVKPLHFYFSVAFFVLLSISLLTIGFTVTLQPSRRGIGLFTLLLGFASAIPWIFSWKGVAIPEALSALAALIWLFVVGFRLLKEEAF